MAAVGDLLAALRAVLAGLDAARASMVEAVLRVDEAAGIMATATAGTSRPEVQASAAEYRQGAEAVRAAGRVVERIAGDIARYAASLEGGGGPVSAPEAGGGVTTPAHRGEHRENPRVAAARERLPPPVARGRGQKTRGEWFSPDGGVGGTVVSGQDDRTGRVDDVLREANIPRSPVLAAKHAELKLAAHMRDNGIRRAVLVLNNVPCPGTYGCDALISVILPEGYVLTVYGPGDFTQDYPGGAKPW